MDLTPALKTIVESGVLGALLLVSWIAGSAIIRILFRLLIDEKDKRLEDAAKISNELMDPIKQIQENGQIQITLLRQFLDKTSKI